jgi:predicted outer membrane repeat protein
MTQRITTVAAALALVGALFVGAPSVARAVVDDLYVGPNSHSSGGSCADPDYQVTGSNDNVQIQAAIDAAASSTVIHLCAGTFSITASLTDHGNPATIVGAGEGATTVEGNCTCRLLDWGAGGPLSLAALTFYNAYATVSGAALAVYDTSLTVEHVTFSENGSDLNGGAIYFSSDAALTIANSTFISNGANGVDDGYGGGALWSSGPTEIRSSTFRSNSATGAGGGAIESTGNITITSSTFADNRSDAGGAVFGNFATVRSSTFTSNSAVYGGAISAGSLVTASSMFSANQAQNGGAIWDCFNDVTNSSFLGNVATRNSGAIGACYGSVAGSTFKENHAGGLAGAVYMYQGGISRSRFIGNSAGTHGGALMFSGFSAANVNRGNLFVRNRAEIGGGAVAINASCTTIGKSVIARFAALNTFTSNRAQQLHRTDDVEFAPFGCG